MMRHSVDTASKNYNKVLESTKETEGPNVVLENEIAEVKIKNEKLIGELKDVSNQCQNVKDHCSGAFEPDNKLYVKRRSDILYRYNKKGVAATDKTIHKYKIKYNNVSQLYE